MRQRAATLVAGTAGLALALAAGISTTAGASGNHGHGGGSKGTPVSATWSDTSGSTQWVPLDASRFTTDAGTSAQATVVVDPAVTAQRYSGIGISLDETSVSNLWKLPKAEREATIKKLVSPTQGAGLDQFRLTIGTPDTIEHMPFTSYDEMPAGQEDWSLEHFSIQHDVTYHIIDTIKLIQKYNPKATFFASAWSAPNWMKTNDRFAGEVALLPGSTTTYYQVGKLRDDAIDVFARYYVKFLQAYAAHGIPVQAITLLNEPGMDVVYPAMDLSVLQQQKLILAVKKQFAKAHLDTKLWVHDFNFWDWKNPNDATTKNYYRIFEDSPDGSIKGNDVRKAADGVAFHPYWGDPGVMKDTAEQTGKPVYMTESGGIDGGTILDYMRLDAGNYNAWTQITDQNGGTLHWTDQRNNDVDWDQVAKTSLWKDRLVTAHTDTGTSTFNPVLGGVGQFARYLDQSDVRVQSSGADGGVKSVVYREDTPGKNPKEFVAVLQNSNAAPTETKVVLGGESFTATLPASSFSTFRWTSVVPSAKGDHAPTLGGVAPVSVDAGSVATVQLRGKDLDGDPLAYYGLDLPAGVTVDARTGVVRIAPTRAGTSTLTFVVTDGAKNTTTTVDLTVNPVATPVGDRVEAEAFVGQHGFSGSFVESTPGTSGGQDVGYTAAGNWLTYLVDVPTAGTYRVEWQVANGTGAAAPGAISLRDASGASLTTVDVPATGGWSTFRTVTTTATLAAGKQTLTVFCTTGGFNLDYWRVVPQ